MRTKILILIIAGILPTIAQNSILMEFKAYDPVVFEPLVDTYSKMFELKYTRVIQDSFIIEKGLFASDSIAISDTFKIEDSIWYIKNQKKWKKFFDKGNQVNGKVMLENEDFSIVWLGMDTLFSKEIFRFKLMPMGYTISHSPIYYFDPNKGVVAIKSEILLIRTDW